MWLVMLKWGERSLLFIQGIEGEETHLLGLLSPHFTEADLDNLCMRENKFKIPLLLVRIRWYLYQNWTSWKEESNAIIISIIWAILRWNLALVANFNIRPLLREIMSQLEAVVTHHFVGDVPRIIFFSKMVLSWQLAAPCNHQLARCATSPPPEPAMWSITHLPWSYVWRWASWT